MAMTYEEWKDVTAAAIFAAAFVKEMEAVDDRDLEEVKKASTRAGFLVDAWKKTVAP